MKMNETLQLVALQLQLNPAELTAFADEDSIGGWDLDGGGWPVGSLWSVEGKALYALVRALKPEHVVEIGTHRGCSATHIATALEINQAGKLSAIDENGASGDLIPEGLRGRIALVPDNGVVWLEGQADESMDIIYEDADHSAETSRDVARLAKRKLKPGGLLIVHDAAHDFAWLGDKTQIQSDVGATIRRGLTQALGDAYRVYRTDPSDCGFALWQKPILPTVGLPGDDGYTHIAGDIHSTPIEKPAPQSKPAKRAKK